jgi:hypothetical protein
MESTTIKTTTVSSGGYGGLKGTTIISIVGIIAGIVILIIGIVLYEINVKNGVAQPWWVWALMIGGLALAIIAGVALAFTLAY